MHVRAKCVRDVADFGDGERLLVSRFRPRFAVRVDRWERLLAPSIRLDFALHRRWITWREYAGLYVAEMWGKAPLLRELAERANTRPVTLLCTCADPQRCHRELLARLVERVAAAAPAELAAAMA